MIAIIMSRKTPLDLINAQMIMSVQVKEHAHLLDGVRVLTDANLKLIRMMPVAQLQFK